MRPHKYIIRLDDLETYSPAGHSRTTNRRLLGPGPRGSQHPTGSPRWKDRPSSF